MARFSNCLNVYDMLQAYEQGGMDRVEQYMEKVNGRVLSTGETACERSVALSNAPVVMDSTRIDLDDTVGCGFMDL